MATSTYEFYVNDTLVKIANIFNTDVKTLVKLNPWLKQNNGKTVLKPSYIDIHQYVGEQYFDEQNQAYNKLYNDSANDSFTVYLNTEPKNLTLFLEVHKLDGTIENYRLLNDDYFYLEGCDIPAEDKFPAKFNIKNHSFEISRTYAITLEYINITYKPLFIIIPIIGNGASSTEDYWSNLDDVIGLQYKTTIDNFISQYLKTNFLGTNDYINGFKDNYGRVYDIANLDRYITDFVDSKLKETSLVDNSVTIADLDTSTLASLVQKAISSISPNDMNQSSFSSKKFTTGIGRSYSVIGNPAYSKCTVRVGETLLNMPCFPDSVEDGVNAIYSKSEILGRSEPFLVYNRTEGRSLSFTFTMHREMTGNEAEIDKIVKVIESGVYPQYGVDIAPQKVEVKIGNQIYISGVMESERTTWSGTLDFNIDKTTGSPADKYNLVTVNFTVSEATNNPKSASDIAQIGGYRTK